MAVPWLGHPLCRAAGGLESLISVLKALSASNSNRELRRTLLSVLLALSVDEATRSAVISSGLIPVLVQLLSTKDDPVRKLWCRQQGPSDYHASLPESDALRCFIAVPREIKFCHS
jgi:hypothetical protein